MLKTRGQDSRASGRRLGLGQRRHLHDGEGPAFGGKVVACSDSGGYVVDEDGIDLDLVKDIKEVRRERISEYARRRGTGSHLCREGLDLGRALRRRDAVGDPERAVGQGRADALLENGVIAVGEGANMPCTPRPSATFQDAGTLFAPGKAANAGGVATSALEMQQNASRATAGPSRQTEERLATIMRGIHDRCAETADEYGAPGDYVLGANIAGFVRVAEAMRALGVI
jgi:glutamate dehydrogenase (NADP+)